MGEALVGRYWCHMCLQMVNPVMEVEIKCPFCEDGFVEEMDSSNTTTRDRDHDSDPASDRALSLWAPILLGMMGPSSRRRRRLPIDEDEEHRESEQEQEGHEPHRSLLRRRRSSAAILQLLQGVRAGIASSESDNNEAASSLGSSSSPSSERDRVILINNFNHAIILQGSFDLDQNNNNNNNRDNQNGGSIGDYFIGPGLDLLLQHLAENDPSRYGTPPAQKEAVEAMPIVKISENLSCSVCIEDFENGEEAREMPCKHKFHDGCILPWLELHSSCPICRFQMPAAPADESKEPVVSSGGNTNAAGNNREESSIVAVVDGGGSGSGSERGAAEEGTNNRRFLVPIRWLFNGLFSLSGSGGAQTGNSTSSTSSSSSSASNSQTNGN